MGEPPVEIHPLPGTLMVVIAFNRAEDKREFLEQVKDGIYKVDPRRVVVYKGSGA